MANHSISGSSPAAGTNAGEKTISGRPAATAGARWGWMFFDWAAQPYNTLVVTFIFGPFFTSYLAPDPETGQVLWGQLLGYTGLLIALAAPILGAIADASGPRKPWIAVFSVVAVAGAWLIYYAEPGAPSAIAIALAGVALATIGFEFAATFNNAMMPDLASRTGMGKLSGSGWALGYVGGIVSLIIVLGFMAATPETGKTLLGLAPVFGLDPATHQGTRAAGPLTAVWYVIFVIPMFMLVPDAPRRAQVSGAVRRGLIELGRTLSNLHRRRSYLSFLIASMLYRDGLTMLHVFGGIYAAGVLGMSIIQIGIFGIIAAVTGVIGAWFGGFIDVRVGTKTVVGWSCVLLILASGAIISSTPEAILFAVPVSEASNAPVIVFYVAGAVVGAAGGSLQAASRAMLVDQVSPREITEAFGLYALSGRSTVWIGPLAIAWATELTGSQRIGVTPAVALLALGLAGLALVKTGAYAQEGAKT